MQLRIRKCKHCPLDKNKCWHRKHLSSAIKSGIAPRSVVLYNCKKYDNIIPFGTLVKVVAWDKDYEENPYGGKAWLQWYEADYVKGWVINVDVRGFYTVRLVKPFIREYSRETIYVIKCYLDKIVSVLHPTPEKFKDIYRRGEEKYYQRRFNETS